VVGLVLYPFTVLVVVAVENLLRKQEVLFLVLLLLL
jgi:hypothetical protein